MSLKGLSHKADVSWCCPDVYRCCRQNHTKKKGKCRQFAEWCPNVFWCVPIGLPMCPYACPPMCPYMPSDVSLCLSMCPYVFQCVPMPSNVSLCLPICPYAFQCVPMSSNVVPMCKTSGYFLFLYTNVIPMFYYTPIKSKSTIPIIFGHLIRFSRSTESADPYRNTLVWNRVKLVLYKHIGPEKDRLASKWRSNCLKWKVI